ncbi:MAG TPA: hypothetical protein VHE30_28135 [Polyangiaceae bacterium]|nr:hypothetical protein [Polyangiaceae bacterium]
MNNGILFNWSVALGGWALGGPLWATVAFLAVALVRISLASKETNDEGARLQRRLELLSTPFGLDDATADDVEPAEAPSSEKRAISGTYPPVRAAS